MKLYLRCVAVIFMAAVFLPACVKMGPDYHRPNLGVEIPETTQHGLAEGGLGSPGDRWWRVFNDPEMNSLVDEVVQHNLDIRQATARILELRSQLVDTRADRFPSLGLQAQASKQRATLTSRVGTAEQEYRATIDSRGLSLPASFELDLWGRLARAEEAALADLLQAEETRRTVAQTVVSETLNLYLEIEALERSIQIAEKRIENYRESLSLVEGRYERGLTSVLDVRQARRILSQAEASLPGLRQRLGIAHQTLAVLLGRYPKTYPPRRQPEDYFRRLSPVPPGLPSELLNARPDVRAAEARLRALNARIGVAKASRFPRITLTGSLGYSSEELQKLFEPESELRSIAMGIVQPIFDAGKLKAGQRAAEARYQQGVAEYAKTVLTAFLEVESALLTRKEQLARRDRVLDFLMEARATQEVAQNRYDRGLVDYLTVLEAMQTRFQAEESLVLVDQAILQNRVNLHRALGGGWAEPAPVPDVVAPGALSGIMKREAKANEIWGREDSRDHVMKY